MKAYRMTEWQAPPEFCNLDQHPVLVHDRVQGLVRLQLSLLEQLFTG